MAFTPDGIAPPGIPLLGCSPPNTMRYSTVFGGDCNVCWASTYPTGLDRLFKLQKKAVYVITKSSFIAHTSPLFQQLKIFNLDQIRQYQTGIFMYRANHNLLPAIFQNYFINIKDIH